MNILYVALKHVIWKSEHDVSQERAGISQQRKCQNKDKID